jgi:hypothetical protein
MEEYFLHFLWQYGLFDTQNLITTDGLLIRPDFRGTHNLNSGPDFSEARIRVGKMETQPPKRQSLRQRNTACGAQP